jgi:methionyl-tRNA formyltransferase
MGTPYFAVPSLRKLANSHYKPVLCITQPDKPKGRKKKLTSPEIKTEADNLNISVLQTSDVNGPDIINKLYELKPDIIITVAFGGYLKKKLRRLPSLGCINLHPSLLPKFRGAAPINYTLFQNEEITGNTIFKIIGKMDAGPILIQEETEILKNENYTDLKNRLAESGANLIVNLLKQVEKEVQTDLKELSSYNTQDHSEATYTQKIEKSDLLLNTNLPALEIQNRVRGLAIKPGLMTEFRSKRIKIIETEITSRKSNQKTGIIQNIIKNTGFTISTKTNDLLIKKVQPAGKKIMSAYDFNLGAHLQAGEKFGF